MSDCAEVLIVKVSRVSRFFILPFFLLIGSIYILFFIDKAIESSGIQYIFISLICVCYLVYVFPKVIRVIFGKTLIRIDSEGISSIGNDIILWDDILEIKKVEGGVVFIVPVFPEKIYAVFTLKSGAIKEIIISAPYQTVPSSKIYEHILNSWRMYNKSLNKDAS